MTKYLVNTTKGFFFYSAADIIDAAVEYVVAEESHVSTDILAVNQWTKGARQQAAFSSGVNCWKDELERNWTLTPNGDIILEPLEGHETTSEEEQIEIENTWLAGWDFADAQYGESPEL